MTQPKLSLIISFYNKTDLLQRVLESVALQTMRDFEVVIADDGSSEENVAKVKQMQQTFAFPIVHVWQEDNGWQKTKILNKAVVAARGEYLVFIDGDCLLERHFLEEHYAARKVGEVVTGRRVMLTEETTKSLLAAPIKADSFGIRLFLMLLWATVFKHQKTQMEQMIRLPYWLRRYLIKERKRYILGCNFSLYKSDLLSVNGFDERFAYPGYGEDIDLEFRLARKGIVAMSRKCQLVEFHCYHKHFDTDYAPNKQLLQTNNNQGITYTLYGIQPVSCQCESNRINNS